MNTQYKIANQPTDPFIPENQRLAKIGQRKSLLGKFGPSLLVVLVAGCAVTPQPLTTSALEAERTKRLNGFLSDQDEVTSPIGIYEAMARAIKYNLDEEVERMEQALRVRELKLARHDLLPKLVAGTGYNGRNNFSGASSSRLLGPRSVGDQSLVASTSSQRDTYGADLLLSWDILDFGLSYVRAKQKADEVLIAAERRRKVVGRIAEDVRTAYWRAVSAERLLAQLQGLEGDIEDALQKSQTVFDRKKAAPLSALTYQRELLSTKEDIQNLQREMSVAKQQLAALMNLDPGKPYTLAMPERSSAVLDFSMPADEMVSLALMNRPEVRENLYQQRITQKSATTALLELLPSLRLFGGFNYDSNEFLFNDQWTGWGARASWNLVQAFKYPAKRRSIRAQQELLDAKANALTMAVITQVHVSRTRFELARRQLNTTKNSYLVQDRILDQVGAGYKTNRVSKQTMIRERMNQILAEARYDLAVADMQNAFANIHSSMGYDPYGDDVSGYETVTDLARKLEQHWENRGDEIAFVPVQEHIDYIETSE